jgi:hypothetical protein
MAAIHRSRDLERMADFCASRRRHAERVHALSIGASAALYYRVVARPYKQKRGIATMRQGACWFLIGCLAAVGCGSNDPAPLRRFTPQEITRLHDLVGHPTDVGDVTSTNLADVTALDFEALKKVLEQPDGLAAALNQMAQQAPDAKVTLWSKGEKRVALPEVEAILGPSSGVVPGPLLDGQADWHQFGWIEIGFVFGGETKGDTSQNAAALRLSVRGYKDSQSLASSTPSK